jgi:hypothetical protein
MSDKIKDIAIRALKTFWQTALASIIFAMPQIIETMGGGWDMLKPVLISVGIGALAAGFSAAYNGVLKPLAERLKANNTSVE